MYNLTDEQIKVLLVSKDSPTISDAVIDNDFSEICVDKFIQSSSDFNKFSTLLTMQMRNGRIDTSKQNNIENIIKSELGDDGLNELLSYTKRKYKEWKIKQESENYMEDERYEPVPQDVLESNTPDEDKEDWDYY
jgi:hypothetical protein